MKLRSYVSRTIAPTLIGDECATHLVTDLLKGWTVGRDLNQRRILCSERQSVSCPHADHRIPTSRFSYGRHFFATQKVRRRIRNQRDCVMPF
jgi:hypothetical protein